MNSSFYGLFLPLSGVAILIFLLSMLQHGISSKIPDDASDARDQSDASNEQPKDINEAGSTPVANAIHSYGRRRDAHESSRAERERVTIIVLTFTAIFAFLAAGAALVSAWFFSGQLNEMHEASVDAKQSLIASNRAWISPMTARIVGSTQNPQLPIFDVYYRNTGKDPALRFTAQEDADSIPLPTRQQIWRNVFETNPLENVCARITKPDTRIAIYPGIDRIYNPAVELTKLIQEISSDHRAIRLHGCFGYNSPITGEAIHKSEYCFLFIHIEGNDPLTFQTISCVYGNDAIEG
jgi:hypothetical protein